MSHLEDVCKDINIPYKLKSEQVSAITSLIEGKHVFVFLPTGFGKSMIPYLTPLVMDKVSFTI